MWQSNNQKLTIMDKCIFLSTVLMLFSITALNMRETGKYVFLAITIFAFFLLILRNKGIFYLPKKRFHIISLAFAIYCLISGIWADGSSQAMQQGITILEISICVFVFYKFYIAVGTNLLLKAIMWSDLLIAIYTIYYYGITGIRLLLQNEFRLSSSDFANSNSIGMAAAMGIVLAFHYFMEEKRKLPIIFSIPALFIVAVSGSRKAIFIILIGIFLELFFTVFKSYSKNNKIRTFFIILGLIFSFYWLSNSGFFGLTSSRITQMFSQLTKNGVEDHSTLVRLQMIQLGFRLFGENPLVGIGMANPGLRIISSMGVDWGYLHNNYVEVLAGGGIIGFLLFYSFYYIPLKVIVRNRLFYEPVGRIIFILIIVLLIMDFGAVTYYSKITYFYFAAFFIYVDFNQEKNHSINHVPV